MSSLIKILYASGKTTIKKKFLFLYFCKEKK